VVEASNTQHTDPISVTPEADGYEFRLFAKPAKGTAQEKIGNTLQKIALRSPTPADRDPGFMQARRPDSFYFTGRGNPEQAKRFQESAVSAEDIMKNVSMRWVNYTPRLLAGSCGSLGVDWDRASVARDSHRIWSDRHKAFSALDKKYSRWEKEAYRQEETNCHSEEACDGERETDGSEAVSSGEGRSRQGEAHTKKQGEESQEKTKGEVEESAKRTGSCIG